MTDTIDTNSSWGDEQIQDGNKLPVFLKVLCILTFVGSGFGIIGGLYGALSASRTRKSFELLRTTDNPFVGKVTDAQIENLIHWQTIAGYVGLVASLLTLTGALLMWRRKKAGFGIYILGEIAPISTAILTAMAASGMAFMGIGTTVGVVFNILIAAAFIIMYGVNYKHLK